MPATNSQEILEHRRNKRHAMAIELSLSALSDGTIAENVFEDHFLGRAADAFNDIAPCLLWDAGWEAIHGADDDVRQGISNHLSEKRVLPVIESHISASSYRSGAHSISPAMCLATGVLKLYEAAKELHECPLLRGQSDEGASDAVQRAKSSGRRKKSIRGRLSVCASF